METLERRFPKYRDWETGTVKPTYRQLAEFAKALDDDPAEVARKMSSTLDFRVDDRSDGTKWEQKLFRESRRAASGTDVHVWDM